MCAGFQQECVRPGPGHGQAAAGGAEAGHRGPLSVPPAPRLLHWILPVLAQPGWREAETDHIEDAEVEADPEADQSPNTETEHKQPREADG